MIIVSKIVATPIGKILLTGNEDALFTLTFHDIQPVQNKKMITPSLFTEIEKALARYFSNNIPLPSFPLAPQGTAFQKKVWNELLKIPFGMQCTYQEIAEGVYSKRAARAVGQAIGRNPISLLIPCHRVIRTDGALGGYLWGHERKEWLLAHEKDCSQ